MATISPAPIFLANTFTGEVIPGFLTTTLLDVESVNLGLWSVMTDINKFNNVLLLADDGISLVNPSAQFNAPLSSPSQNEIYLSPVRYEFMKELDLSAEITSWESMKLPSGSMEDYDGDKEFTDFVMGRYVEKLQITNERLYWNGKALTPEALFTQSYLGILAKLEANSSVRKANLTNSPTSQAVTISTGGVVTHAAPAGTYSDGDVVTIVSETGGLQDTSFKVNGNAVPVSVVKQSYQIKVLTSTTFQLMNNYLNQYNAIATFSGGPSTAAQIQCINVTNVIGFLTTVYANLPFNVRRKPDFNLIVSLHIAYAYKAAQSLRPINVLNQFNNDKPLDFIGEKLIPLNHLQANIILGARRSNLFLGVDKLGDFDSLEVVNMRETTLDQTIRMKAAFKSDQTVAFGQEVYYVRPSMN